MPAHGRYTVVRKIADGGMAEIFLGKQHGAEGFERPVVLKRILTAFYADPQFRNLLIDEAHVAMSLLHGNIAQVVDLGQSSGRYFLVMELVDGWDLNQILQRARATGVGFPPELALYVSAEVCRGLHYAHSRTKDGKTLGIVHRDVSPHNVLLSEQGEVKLTDFGIAKALGKRDRTGTGVIKGKLAFMSPEQASGAVLDRRSDLFSVGTMLYVMTCGRKPFEAPTDLESMLRIQKADFPAPQTVVPAIAAPLAAAIARAMRLLPSERYQSAEEMLEDLERVQREAFKPAGQTELKRWLAELGQKDGSLPISRRNPPPGPAGDAVDGLDVVLEEPGQDGVGATVSLSTPAPVWAPPPSTAPPAGAGDSQATRVDTPASLGRSRSDAPAGSGGAPTPASRRGLQAGLAVGLVAAAIAIGLGIAGLRPDRDGSGAGRDLHASSPTRGRDRPPPRTPPPATRPGSVESSGDAAGGIDLPATDAGAAERAAEGSPDSSTPGAFGGGEEEPGEEELLRQAEQGAAEKVIGGDESGGQEGGKKEAPLAAETVTVKVSSKPDGAVVRVGRKVLGRTPLSPRFRSGIEYDVSFLKTGYVTLIKRVKVTTKKKQALAVVLKKKQLPPKARGILQRIFPAGGGRDKR